MPNVSGTNGKVQGMFNDSVAEIRLTSPDRRNCFSPELVADLDEVLTETSYYDDLHAILLTAEDPVYCAGADTSILSESPDDVTEISDILYEVFEWLRNTPVPVVAAASGDAVGAGASWFCYVSDLKVASPNVDISWPEVEYGRVTYPRSVFLTVELGPSKAAEMLLLGEKLSAEEGKQLGLVNRVVPKEKVESTGRELASRLAEFGTEYGVARDYLETIYHTRRELGSTSDRWADWMHATFDYQDRRTK
jgi:enoyl-CoA hydratase/carnithine racemase